MQIDANERIEETAGPIEGLMQYAIRANAPCDRREMRRNEANVNEEWSTDR